MRLGTIFYAFICLLGLAYLAAANVRGYIPFVANAASVARGTTASHFHK